MRRHGRAARLALLLSTVVAAAAVPQAVFIQEARAAEKKNVAVGAFEGPKSDEVRSAFIESLKKDGGYEVTDAEDVKHMAKDKAIVDAAKGLAVSVIITGKITKLNLKLKVRDGSTGKTLDQVDIKGGTLPKLKTNVEKTGASSVEAPIGRSKGEKAKTDEKKKSEQAKKDAEEQPAEAAKEEEEKPAEESAPSAPGEPGKLTPLEITAGLRPIHRTLDFHQSLQELRPDDGFYPMLRYELPLGPALFIDFNVYPGSFISSGPAEWIGITGGFEKGFAVESVFQEGKPPCSATLQSNCELTLKTDLQQWYLGARFRFPVAAHLLSASGTYGSHDFTLAGDERQALVPDIEYSYVKLDLSATLTFGEFLGGAHIGKRFVLGVGPIGERTFQNPWFPSAKAQSIEFGVMFGYKLVSMLDLVAGFDFLRYAYDFNPDPPNPYVPWNGAGGAVDDYYTGYIAFRFHLPAKAGAGDGTASVSASTE
ncbi:MAG TPA: hypothetical protein VJN18_18075 [Polyangiaceae bacterium]|nr:hypothetical protein [Polyangiaceae bacterium]